MLIEAVGLEECVAGYTDTEKVAILVWGESRGITVPGVIVT